MTGAKIPPAMWQDPDAFDEGEGDEGGVIGDIANHARADGHDDHHHEPTCGHPSEPHGDHVDYLHDGVRHFAHEDHWDAHT